MAYRFLDPKSSAHPFTTRHSARPHIFLISMDMIPREAYDPESPYRRYLQTPHLDRLFAEGIFFEYACSVSPLCGPSRAAYLTGRYPYLTVNEERAHDGWQTRLRREDAIFPEYLKAAGYLTKHIGKAHVGTEKFLAAFGENDTPWNRWAPPLGDDDSYLTYLDSLGLQLPVWPAPLVGLHPDRQTPGNRLGGFVQQSNGRPFPVEGLYDFYLASLARQKLFAALRQRQPTQPLYLQLDFFGPHQPFMIPESYNERFEELRKIVTLPPSCAEAMRGVSAWPRVYRFYLRNWGLYDPERARDYIAFNFLQIELLDEALGHFLTALTEAGLYEESVIIFLGDHGEMNTERGLVDKGVYGHPKVALTPLVLKLPHGQHAGRRISALVSLLDIAPTIFALTGLQPAERLDGCSLLEIVDASAAEGSSNMERELLFETGWHVCPNPAVALIAEGDGQPLMYTYNLCDEHDELYALADRTYIDHAKDPAWASVKQEMIRRLGAVLAADPRWTCYWHPFRLDKYEVLGRPGGDFQMFRPE